MDAGAVLEARPLPLALKSRIPVPTAMVAEDGLEVVQTSTPLKAPANVECVQAQRSALGATFCQMARGVA